MDRTSKATESDNSDSPKNAAKKTSSIDMLHGPLLGKLVLFAIPPALSSIISRLFNSSDATAARAFH